MEFLRVFNRDGLLREDDQRVAVDVLEPLDVLRDLPAQLTFHDAAFLDDRRDPGKLLVGQFLRLYVVLASYICNSSAYSYDINSPGWVSLYAFSSCA